MPRKKRKKPADAELTTYHVRFTVADRARVLELSEITEHSQTDVIRHALRFYHAAVTRAVEEKGGAENLVPLPKKEGI